MCIISKKIWEKKATMEQKCVEVIIFPRKLNISMKTK
jgi:hypothetical protein